MSTLNFSVIRAASRAAGQTELHHIHVESDLYFVVCVFHTTCFTVSTEELYISKRYMQQVLTNWNAVFTNLNNNLHVVLFSYDKNIPAAIKLINLHQINWACRITGVEAAYMYESACVRACVRLPFWFYGPSRLFHSFWAESIVRWGENRRSPRQTTWPPGSRTWLVSHVTRAELEPDTSLARTYSGEMTSDLER